VTSCTRCARAARTSLFAAVRMQHVWLNLKAWQRWRVVLYVQYCHRVSRARAPTFTKFTKFTVKLSSRSLYAALLGQMRTLHTQTKALQAFTWLYRTFTLVISLLKSQYCIFGHSKLEHEGTMKFEQENISRITDKPLDWKSDPSDNWYCFKYA